MKARLAAIKGPCEHFLKARLLDVYRDDNHMACYNFSQQCKDHFATDRAKRPNGIFLLHFFSKIASISKGNNISGS